MTDRETRIAKTFDASRPCTLCGEPVGALSFGGPSICPSCDCGRPPEARKLAAALAENTRLLTALSEVMGERDAAEKGYGTYAQVIIALEAEVTKLTADRDAEQQRAEKAERAVGSLADGYEKGWTIVGEQTIRMTQLQAEVAGLRLELQASQERAASFEASYNGAYHEIEGLRLELVAAKDRVIALTEIIKNGADAAYKIDNGLRLQLAALSTEREGEQ